MLATLRVHDFVLIAELEVRFGPGLNVLTGETGAGKSIVVDALGLVLGGRGSPDLVREGSSEAGVEALFEIEPGSAAMARLEAGGVPCDGELVIRRSVGRTGRSRVYLNGRLGSVGELTELGPLLMDIASQHESVSLTDPATHLAYLDTFAKLESERALTSGAFDELKALVQRARDAEARAKGRAEREAFLRFQLAAIDDVAPEVGEDERLAAERGRLRHAAKLAEVTRRAAGLLDDGDAPIVDVLGRLAADLRAVENVDRALAEPAAALEAARVELAEVARFLGRYLEGIEADPNRLDAIETRLFALEKLRRQHGVSLADVLAARAALASEIETLEGAEDALEAAHQATKAAHARTAKLAKALSAKRKAAASKLGEAITRELAALGMGAAKVAVEVAPLDAALADAELAVDGAKLSRDGIDRVEFLIAPNKGTSPRPLRKVASGGELSRALLALKRVLAEGGPAGTYVFDEVDTGVGGGIATSIGRALGAVAKHRQVLCITHLAPIAAFADQHFVVAKSAEGESTKTTIAPVEGKARVAEIARMLSGETVTASARQAADELIREAHGAAIAPEAVPPAKPKKTAKGGLNGRSHRPRRAVPVR